MKPVFRISVFLILIVFGSCKEKSSSNNYYYDTANYIVLDTIFDKMDKVKQILYVNKHNPTRGFSKFFYLKNGNLHGEVFFHYLKRDGPASVYFYNGAIMAKTYYKNDTITGKEIIYYENGEIDRIMYYKMGKEVGTWKTFDTTGHLIDSTVYK